MGKEKGKKPDTTIIVAILGLIGTVIAALLGSPLLSKLLEPSTPTPSAVVTAIGNTEVPVFSQDFENGASGFSFDQGSWIVGKDKSNKVLSIDASSAPAIASFGPNDFTNGVIEFKINFQQFSSDSAMLFNFRRTSEATYAVSFTQNQVAMGYRDIKNNGAFEPFSADSARAFTFQNGTWYTIHAEARGSELILTIDNNRQFSATDDRIAKGGFNFEIGQGNQVMFDDLNIWALR